jgi:hypothetical protein
MKSIFLFSSRLRVYITEFPPVALLIVSIIFNNKAENLLKLYPLIIVLSALVIFIGIYFFRGVLIKKEEVRAVGFFSTREKAVIKKERALVITVLPKKKLRIELFGDGKDGLNTYTWLKEEEQREINLFRAKGIGKAKKAKKILSFFNINDEHIQKAFEGDKFSVEYEKLIFSSSIRDESRVLRIYFKETV